MVHLINLRALPAFAITTVAVFCVLSDSASAQPLGPGDLFPDFSHINNLDTSESDYLGIDAAARLNLGSIKQDIIILEFLNVFCDMCREDVELYNELYETSRSHPDLAGTFAVLGIAVGNSFEEVMQFSDELFVQYPILLDSERKILSLTGSVRGAPQTYMLQRQGNRYVIRHFSRSATDMDQYLALLRTHQDKQSKGSPSTQRLSYCFMVNGEKYTEKQFTGSRVLLYFPHQRTYPHKADTRNTTRQVAALSRVLELHPDMRIIIIEQNTNPINALKGLNLPPGFTRATCDNGMFDLLASKDYPTVCYIDETGNAVFKGQALTLSALRSMIEKGRYRPKPDMSENEIISLIDHILAAQDPSVVATVQTKLNDHNVYRTQTKTANRFYYSRLESSPSLCDLCHDSHFIYSINSHGTIVALIPVALPKRGNVHWTPDEVASFQTAFKGKNIHTVFQFNAKTDAVSGATITSSIVYDGFNRGKKIFQEQKVLSAGRLLGAK